jgi:hypothetical protein
MSISIAPDRLRFALHLHSHDVMTDLLTGATPLLWCRTEASIEIAVFYNGYLVEDFTNITKIVAELHASDRVSAPLWQKEITSFDDTLILPDWDSKAVAKMHATVDLAHADTAVDVSGGATDNTASFWLVFHAVMTDGSQVVCGVANITFEDHGAQTGLGVTGILATAYRLSPTTGLPQFYNPDTQRWHGFQPRGAAGAVTTAWDQTGED